MKTRPISILLIATLFVLACNFPLFTVGTQPPATPGGGGPISTNTPTPTSIAVLPSLTSIPASPTAVSTPTVPEVTPISSAVNCRSGPDVAYNVVSTLGLGQVAEIAGRNDDSSWWYIHDPANPGSFCWVAAAVVTTLGNLAGLLVITPPSGIVTKVTVDVSVGYVSCGGPNPSSFSGTITTNGPAKVKFDWEIRGDKSNTTSPETINFKTAGTKDAPDPGSYSSDCGHFSITLHVLSPNDISATKKYKVGP
jgi:uncharacterized protein YraI